MLVESEAANGTITSPLSKCRNAHVRICHPVSLGEAGRARVVAFACSHVGDQYDVKNFIDLMRYLLPTPPVPARFRRRMIALGADEPTRSICWTLIAQAFQSVNYPILRPVERIDDSDARVRNEEARREILRIRHRSLFAPRDFGISPYFAIVKPTIESGFDYRSVEWAQDVPPVQGKPPPSAP